MIRDLINAFRFPKYVVMKGCQVSDRALLFMGRAEWGVTDKNGHGDLTVDKGVRNFRHSTLQTRFAYYNSGVYFKIRTYRQLIRWRRLIGGNKCHEMSSVMQKTKLGGWVDINKGEK